MTRASPSLRPPSDPLERARLAAEDARDIAKDELRRLPDYSADDEEDTARHEVHNHTHVHMPSSPDVKVETVVELGPVKVRGLPKWMVGAVAALVAAITALVAHLLAR